MSKTFTDISREDWQPGERPVLVTDIQTGCLQRIADATETMAKNYVELQKELDFYKRRFAEVDVERQHLKRSVVAHKANYTRLKRKMER